MGATANHRATLGNESQLKSETPKGWPYEGGEHHVPIISQSDRAYHLQHQES